MTKADELYQKYSKLFSQTLINGGISCGIGWFDILNELSAALEKLIVEEGADIKAAQVKEKFGGLRFYLDYGSNLSLEHNKKIGALISEAEGKSFRTCDSCGKPGTMRNGPWIVVRCDEHAPKAKVEE